VTAVDPHGATAVTNPTGSFFVSLANNAPSTPVISSPLDGATVTTLTPTLTILNSTDPESDPIRYLFELDVSPNFGSAAYTSAILADGSNGTAGAAGTTSWNPGTLVENATYFWRVRGLDPYHGGNFANGSFFVNAKNDPPSALLALSPVGGALVTPQNVVFSVQDATDPDSTQIFVNFFVYASSNTAGAVVLTSSGDIAQTPGQTHFTPPAGKLKGGKQYFWKAVAHDDLGSFGPETPLQNFQTITVGGGSGCSCSTTESHSASPLLAIVLGGAAIVLTRRRRHGAS
ncbi:MAG TPA: MYXO-CTERM sorting domain-containing protein, partial [bacterium]|nr:MYXO-CTERM sorting domain-containing protein [bacterium]